jgi:3'(2'), 5'-bisphosphate nucleotidase
MDYAALIPPLRRVVAEAGAEIMRFYERNDGAGQRAKADQSPVTDADLAADAIIADALAVLAPDIPAISEETFDGTFTLSPEATFWLIDPLDGTREFLSRTGEFTVNIGLIVDRRPVLGIVGAPVFGEIFWGIVGQGAWRDRNGVVEQIHVRPRPEIGITVAGSRYHGNPTRLDNFLKDYNVASRYQRGSSYKFCDVASGVADLNPALNCIHEWDTAAGHAIVVAAGGSVRTMDGQDLMYGKPGLDNPPYVVSG